MDVNQYIKKFDKKKELVTLNKGKSGYINQSLRKKNVDKFSVPKI
ncbi:hypothetical protein [Clostridium sp. DL1XJH146]